MRDGNSEEKRFSEDVDRQLAGQEVDSGAQTSEQYRDALTVSRKLIECRADIRPAFQAQLKHRLTSRLMEQEVDMRESERRREGLPLWRRLGSLMARNPALSTATMTFVFALLSLAALWRIGMFSTASPEASVTQIEPSPQPAPFGTMATVPAMSAQSTQPETLTDQSRTANGIVMVLKRVERGASEANFSVLNVPQGYSKTSPQMARAPVRAKAEYSFDGRTFSSAGQSEVEFLDEGILHTWRIAVPIPDTATAMIIRVSSLGDTKGPWEFTVQLK
ncbi:MAG: hypothetical protein HYX87_04680 [Chloroflexi bacterium]|nr:hypothetical protein [Chloroflexota bacterium]